MIRERRSYKIEKFPAKTFTIKKLYDYLIEYLQTGPYGWQLMRNEPTPYGAVFKVPNYREGEYGCVGLMYDELRVGTTYWNWLKQNDVLKEEFARNPDGLNWSDFSIIPFCSNGNVYRWVYAPNYVGGVMRERWGPASQVQYRFSPTPDIFVKDADVIFGTTFKQYEKAFTWKELMGNERQKNIGLKRIDYYGVNQVYPTRMNPPLYPGVGCPALGSAPTFYKDNSSETTNITLYLTRTKHNMMAVINFKNYFDLLSVGFFNPFDSDNEYSFPAMAVSSMSGVSPRVELLSYRGERPWPECNMKLDFTQRNSAFSHAMPNYPSSYWDGTKNYLSAYQYSSVQAMLPDGTWKSFADIGYRSEYYYHYTHGQFFQSLKEPEILPQDYSLFIVSPGITDISRFANVLPSIVDDGELEVDFDNINDYITKLNY